MPCDTEREKNMMTGAMLLLAAGAVAGNVNFEHFAVPAMSEIKRLPDARPTDVAPGGTVRIFAAQDEFEPGSFVIKAERDLGKVQLTLSPFRTEQGAEFPAGDLDLKVIKVWYQNRNGWYSYFGDTGFALCPELLLNDEDLIRVDTAKTANYARLTEKDGTVHEQWINPPRQLDVRETLRPWNQKDTFEPMRPNFTDAKTLQPVALAKDAYKQFFLTVHVRKGTKPGLYRGAVKVGDYGSIPVELKVLDFELPQPKCQADPEKDFLVSSYSYISYDLIMEYNGYDLDLARQQLKAVLRDQVEHNQTMHMIRGGSMKEEPNYFWDTLREVGMRTDVIMGYMSPQGKEPEEMSDFAKRAAAYIDARFGHHNIYVGYGDEPSAKWLEKVRPVYRAYQNEGFKFFIAGSDSVFHKAGYLYDWHNIAKEPCDDSSTRLWNFLDSNNRIAWYANHHVGPENPAFNRRQNGLGAWLAGYTALCNYAHHFGPYNDDSTTYKPMVLAYGTGDGVIDTLGWEGFREGIDDIRYATLLAALARNAEKSADTETRYLGGKALGYLATFRRDSGDQDTARMEMIGYIERLLAKGVASGIKPTAAPAPFKPTVEPGMSAACREEVAAAKGKNEEDTVRAQVKVLDKYFLYGAGAKLLEERGLYNDAARKYAGDQLNDRTSAERCYLAFLAQTNVNAHAKRDALVYLLPKHPELEPMIAKCFDEAAVKRGWPDTNTVLRAYSDILGSNHRTYLVTEDFKAYRSFFRAYAKFAATCGQPLNEKAAFRGAYVGALMGDAALTDAAVKALEANPKAATNNVYQARLYAAAAGFKTAEDVKRFDERWGGAIAMPDRVKAIESAGSAQMRRSNETAVRAMSAYRKSLYRPEPKNRYLVKFSDTPLRDAENWGGLTVTPAKFAYERKYGGSTEFMTTDVSTGDRGAGNSGEKFENPWMEVVADEWGLHFRFTTPDPKAREVELGLTGAGSFEGYLAPGAGEPYICLMMTPGDATAGIFNTQYDTFGHRRVKGDKPGMCRFNTFYTDDKVICTLSLSWENYMDRIPENGAIWDFENMRWTRSGNFCFNGTESIHGRSTWGELEFALTPAQRVRILKRLIFKAWKDYKVEVNGRHGYEGCVIHWQDTAVGDPAFYDAKVKPLVERLAAYEPLMTADISDENVLKVAREALPIWHNICFEISRLRTEYLKETL